MSVKFFQNPNVGLHYCQCPEAGADMNKREREELYRRTAVELNKPDCAERTAVDPALETDRLADPVKDLEPSFRTFARHRRRSDPEEQAREFWESIFRSHLAELVGKSYEAEWACERAGTMADYALFEWKKRFHPAALGSETPTPTADPQEPASCYKQALLSILDAARSGEAGPHIRIRAIDRIVRTALGLETPALTDQPQEPGTASSSTPTRACAT